MIRFFNHRDTETQSLKNKNFLCLCASVVQIKKDQA